MSAYVILMREKTKDSAELDIYREKAVAAREGHNMKPLARYTKMESLEGAPVEGVMIIEFPTFAEAKAWYDSPAYREARKHRFPGADYRALIVEGV
jgi:uncharacterized protein (DUF1330 family)